MENRYIVPLLCVAAVAYACGPWVHSSESEHHASSTPTASPTHAHSKTPRIVATTFDVMRIGHQVALALRVTNNTTKTVELRFPSGQTHDFVVLDSTGRAVWRWSEGRMFTQAMQSKTVRSKDAITIEDAWDASAAHGAYVAVATLNTDQQAIERRVEFRIP